MDFRTPYGCSKGAADQYVQDYSKTFNLKTVVFRHSSLYGGRQFSTYDQGWIGWFCQKAIEDRDHKPKKPFTISGNGKQVRDVLHVDDAVRLYFAVLDHIEKAKGEVFNIGGGFDNSLSLLELFDLLEELSTASLQYKMLPFRKSDQKVFISDNTKAKQILGWEPQTGKMVGIKKMLEWIENGR